MYEAGGRLFVDVTRGLASPASRAGLLAVLGKSDPLIGDAMQTILDRGDFIPSLPGEGRASTPSGGGAASIETDPAIVTELIARTQASIAALKRDILTRSGTALLDFILADLLELKRILFDPQSHGVVVAGMEATWWLNERLQAWLGETNPADTLTGTSRSCRSRQSSRLFFYTRICGCIVARSIFRSAHRLRGFSKHIAG